MNDSYITFSALVPLHRLSFPSYEVAVRLWWDPKVLGAQPLPPDLWLGSRASEVPGGGLDLGEEWLMFLLPHQPKCSLPKVKVCVPGRQGSQVGLEELEG